MRSRVESALRRSQGEAGVSENPLEEGNPCTAAAHTLHGVFMRVIWGKCSIALGYDVRDYGGVHGDWIRGFVPVLREFGLAYPATRPGWA